MSIDRQATEKPLKDWVISDKESLKAWVRRFLWHYEGVCSGNGEEEAPDTPEVIIVESVTKALAVLDSEGKRQTKLVRLPDPITYFQVEGIHQE